MTPSPGSPRPPLLDDAALAAVLASRPRWRREGAQLAATFRLPDFRAAVAFTQAIADAAEAQQHHPEWTVRWRSVDVRTTTHDAGGLTQRDLALAAAIDALAAAAGAE